MSDFIVGLTGGVASGKSEVTRRFQALGVEVAGVTASPLPGPSGNVEYFLWLTRGRGGATVDGAPHGAPLRDDDLRTAIQRAVREGPQ